MKRGWLSVSTTLTFLAAAAQQPGPPAPFPTFVLPKTSWVEVPGTPTPISDAFISKFVQQEADCRDCTRAISYPVSLGSLGRSTLLQIKGEVCGATGNCPFYLVVRSSAHRQIFPVGYGWSFTIAPSSTGVPDVFTQANMSCCDGILQRFSYLHGSFQQTGCDAINGALIGTKRMGGPPSGDESIEATDLKISHC